MLKNLLIQAVVFVLIFQFVSWVRETNMLASDTQVSQDIVLTSLDGDEVAIKANEKPLVLYFFAPWCQICHMSIGNLQSIYEKNSDIDVIAVALDFTEQDEVLRFTKQHQLTFPVVYGNERIKQELMVSGYPSYYVLNEDNSVESKSMGYSTELGIYLRAL